jgi:Tfp pilus assembly protein PilF
VQGRIAWSTFEAEALYEREVRADKDLLQPQWGLAFTAKVYVKAEDLELGEEYFRKAVRVNPKD